MDKINIDWINGFMIVDKEKFYVARDIVAKKYISGENKQK